MTKKEFIKRYAKKHGISIEDSTTLCEGVFQLMGDILYKEGQNLVISGFGTFKQKFLGGKAYGSVNTGKVEVGSPKRRVGFKQSERVDCPYEPIPYTEEDS